MVVAFRYQVDWRASSAKPGNRAASISWRSFKRDVPSNSSSTTITTGTGFQRAVPISRGPENIDDTGECKRNSAGKTTTAGAATVTTERTRLTAKYIQTAAPARARARAITSP